MNSLRQAMVAISLAACFMANAALAQPASSAATHTAAKPSKTRTTTAQVQRFLADNPQLTRGITLEDGSTAKALRAIPGGIRYRIVPPGPNEQPVVLDVVGPPGFVLKENGLKQVWNAVKDMAGKVAGIFTGGSGSGGGSGQQGCGNVKTSTDGNGNVNIIVVNCSDKNSKA